MTKPHYCTVSNPYSQSSHTPIVIDNPPDTITVELIQRMVLKRYESSIREYFPTSQEFILFFEDKERQPIARINTTLDLTVNIDKITKLYETNKRYEVRLSKHGDFINSYVFYEFPYRDHLYSALVDFLNIGKSEVNGLLNELLTTGKASGYGYSLELIEIDGNSEDT